MVYFQTATKHRSRAASWSIIAPPFIRRNFVANSTAGTYVVDAFVAGVSTPASFTLTNTASAISGIDFYDVVSGAFSATYNRTLSGGPYAGQTIPQAISSGARVDVRDVSGSDSAIFDANGGHFYSLTVGTFDASYNPTLSGGPYAGQTVGQVFSSGSIVNTRNSSGSNLGIFNINGVHLYNLVGGAFAISRNPTLSGGQYGGQSIGQLFSSGVQMWVRDTSGSELVIVNGSGAHFYNIASGAFTFSHNPTLSGGPHYNLKVSDAFNAGIMVRVRNLANSDLVLLSAPVVGAPATITAISGHRKAHRSVRRLPHHSKQ